MLPNFAQFFYLLQIFCPHRRTNTVFILSKTISLLTDVILKEFWYFKLYGVSSQERNTSFVADKKQLTILCSSIAEAYRFFLSVEAELSVSIISIVYSATLIFLASFSLKIKWHLSGITFSWLSVNHWNKENDSLSIVLKITSVLAFAAYGGQYNCFKIWCFVRNKWSMAILKKWV